jgi:hypothetical protein
MILKRIKFQDSYFIPKVLCKKNFISLKGEESTKVEMKFKKYITHDTFIAKYLSNSVINIPCGMHVSVM